MSYLSRRDKSILIGNVLDHFDTALYSFLAPLLAPLFFPHADPLVALIMAYSVFITSFFTKPLGTFIFGVIAQNHSPAISLSYSLIGVAITTVLIGFIPSHATIGVAAPILLIVIRAIRGVFASGESAISKLYILQDKTEKHAFKSSYIYHTSSILGILMASTASTIVFFVDFEHAWRICFLLGGLTGFVGYAIRQYQNKPAERKVDRLLNSYNPGGMRILWQNRLNLLKVALVNSFSHLTYSIPFFVMNSLVPLISDVEIKTMMSVNSMLLVFDLFMIPIIGKRLEKYDYNKVMLYSSGLLAITIMPMWYFITSGSLLYISFVRLWIVVMGIIFLCPLTLWCNNLVKGEEKYLVIGMGGALGATSIGRMSPAISLYLYRRTGDHLSVGIFIASILIATVITILATKNPLDSES